MAPYQKTKCFTSIREQQTQRENALDQMVGLGRLELPTSRLSSARSNQLSYKPLTREAPACAQPAGRRCVAQAPSPRAACSSAKKEKRRRQNPANGAQRSGDRWPLMFLKRSDSERELAEGSSLER